MSVTSAPSPGASRPWQNLIVIAGLLVIVGVLVWQAITSSGNPDPLAEGISRPAAVLNCSILVFREGLEAVLVLTALTVSLVRARNDYWRPIMIGSALSFVASVITWFLVVAVMSTINAPALDIQAGTGLLAIVVLMLIMNWFFHQIYWSGWIVQHNRWKQNLLSGAERNESRIFKGLVLLGFSCVYREGFEIVLFLQSVRLRSGNGVVGTGLLIGLGLTAIVAFLTFVAQRRLPYRKMLVLTGVMLGAVLLVMVGESVQEMQQAHWISTTEIGVDLPPWMGTWFAIFPNAEGLIAQLAAGLIVGGSYFLAGRAKKANACQADVTETPISPLVCEKADCSEAGQCRVHESAATAAAESSLLR